MKNQSNSKKNSKKESSKNVQENIESLLRESKSKIRGSSNLYKFNPDLHPKFKEIASYEELNAKGLGKNYRGILRNKREKIQDDLLGKDRSMEDRLNAKKEFLQFFKDNYLSDSLSIESISQSSNESIRKDIGDAIKMISMI